MPTACSLSENLALKSAADPAAQAGNLLVNEPTEPDLAALQGRVLDLAEAEVEQAVHEAWDVLLHGRIFEGGRDEQARREDALLLPGCARSGRARTSAGPRAQAGKRGSVGGRRWEAR